MKNFKIDIISNEFVNRNFKIVKFLKRHQIVNDNFLGKDGVFKLEQALEHCGKIAGVCYDKEGYSHLLLEDASKTKKRVNQTLESGHHSVYEHVSISLNMQNIHKILAMFINNEKQYTTSEKSMRYTTIDSSNDSAVTEEESYLYEKWLNIFKMEIAKKYGHILKAQKMAKLALENARYLISVSVPTQMIYTTNLRQLNIIASFIKRYKMEYILNDNPTSMETMLYQTFNPFYAELERLNLLVPELMQNTKDRKFSLNDSNNQGDDTYFNYDYRTIYSGSYAQLAQAQRHRTLNYKLLEKSYFEPYTPPILENPLLINEWLKDINSLKEIVPQGTLVTIIESGSYENFISKCKERLCLEAQLEINDQTKETLLTYKAQLQADNHVLGDDINKYSNGARCTFCDYTCKNNCHFNEAKLLTRKI